LKSKAQQTWDQPYRLRIQCSRTADWKSQGLGERNRQQKGTKCPFRASIQRERKREGFGDSWHIKIDQDSHNHGLKKEDLDGDATARRAQRDALDGKIDTAVEELSSITTMTSRQFATYLTGSSAEFVDTEGDRFQADPEVRNSIHTTHRQIRESKTKISLSAQDVRNIQRALRATRYNYHTTTRRLIELLDTHKELHGIDYFVDWIESDDGKGRRPRAIFWTYKWCLEMWRQNPEVLVIDNTYKVRLCCPISPDFTLLLLWN
jgi:hypothetical protein